MLDRSCDACFSLYLLTICFTAPQKNFDLIVQDLLAKNDNIGTTSESNYVRAVRAVKELDQARKEMAELRSVNAALMESLSDAEAKVRVVATQIATEGRKAMAAQAAENIQLRAKIDLIVLAFALLELGG